MQNTHQYFVYQLFVNLKITSEINFHMNYNEIQIKLYHKNNFSSISTSMAVSTHENNMFHTQVSLILIAHVFCFSVFLVRHIGPFVFLGSSCDVSPVCSLDCSRILLRSSLGCYTLFFLFCN